MKTNALMMLALGMSLIAAQGPAPQAAAQGGQTFLTGGGCATIPGVGSPILMISNAHKFIEDALNIKNTYTNVKYVYFLKTTPAVDPTIANYRLVFSVTDYNGTKYVAVDLDQSPFGIGSIKINKFLMTGDVARVRQFIDPNFSTRVTFTCGDMKFVYSSFGNDPTPQFDYLFPGRNQNSAGLNVLNNLLPSSGSSGALPQGGRLPTAAGKTCVTANFIETNGFFGAPSAATPVDSISCLPNENAVAQIRVGCVNNVLQSLQLVFNNLNDAGTTAGTYLGNPNITATSITTVDLAASTRVTFTRTTTPNTLRIQTVDANGAQLTNFVCGTGTASPNAQTILTANFLGVTAFATATGIDGLELVSYAA